jgi:hypothetical protein
MLHVLRTGAFVLVYLGASYGLYGQTPDTRLDDAVREIAQLVRLQQSAILAAARPAPAISWRTLEGWSAVKVGMSRDQVVEILGEPKSTDVVMDRQTLFYKDAAAVPIGQVVITDDRVSEVTSSRFQIYVPAQK